MNGVLIALVVAATTLGASEGAAGGDAGAEDLHIRVDLPAFTLQIVEDGRVTRTFPITVGLPTHRTPIGNYYITRIIWNPWWNPPDSEWAAEEEVTPPGPANPMGRVKMGFTGVLYLHGTVEVDLLGGLGSHGCVRLSNEHALEVARLLARRAGVLEDDEIDALEAAPARTRRVELPEPVRIEIRYRLVQDVDGELQRYDDVYGRGLSAADRALLAGSRGASR